MKDLNQLIRKPANLTHMLKMFKLEQRIRTLEKKTNRTLEETEKLAKLKLEREMLRVRRFPWNMW